MFLLCLCTFRWTLRLKEQEITSGGSIFRWRNKNWELKIGKIYEEKARGAQVMEKWEKNPIDIF